MLSRTADHLFWMSRYMERAENTARMLDVNYQTSLMPQSADDAEKGWKGLLGISELSGDYAKRHTEVTPRQVMEYMVLDAQNPSSIRSCLMAARENARPVAQPAATRAATATSTTPPITRLIIIRCPLFAILSSFFVLGPSSVNFKLEL